MICLRCSVLAANCLGNEHSGNAELKLQALIFKVLQVHASA